MALPQCFICISISNTVCYFIILELSIWKKIYHAFAQNKQEINLFNHISLFTQYIIAKSYLTVGEILFYFKSCTNIHCIISVQEITKPSGITKLVHKKLITWNVLHLFDLMPFYACIVRSLSYSRYIIYL